jgi:hypothetical protein
MTRQAAKDVSMDVMTIIETLGNLLSVSLMATEVCLENSDVVALKLPLIEMATTTNKKVKLLLRHSKFHFFRHLPNKKRIKQNTIVVLIDLPPDFVKSVGSGVGARIRSSPNGLS